MGFKELAALNKSNKQRDEERNKKLNLTLREKDQQSPNAGTWQVSQLRDVHYHPQVAATESDKTGRTPRARVVAYDPEENTLIVVFWDNTWWQYNNVPVQMWSGISSTSSTGGFLHDSGLNSWGDMHEADIDPIPLAVRAQISQMAMSATRLRSGA